MKEWNAESISGRLQRIANEANKYLHEVQGKAESRITYQHVHDEYLAKYYVYNYLHGRTFLASRGALLEA